MNKSIFEQFGGTYTQQGDYLLPDLKLPDTENREVGVWGQRYGRWLKAQHRVMYYNLLTSGRLNAALAEADERANNLFLRTVKVLAEKEGVTEKLKADDPMAWVRKMNNIRQRASEIVQDEIFVL